MGAPDGSRRARHDFVIDFNRGGKPIGIEITAPTKVSAAV
jgi:hypothetical protein